MSRTSKTLLRLGVPSLAAATLVAGIPAFLVGTAQAAPGDTLTQTPTTASAPAGVCTFFTTSLNPVRQSVTIDVQLAPRAANVNVNFCTVTAGVSTGTGTAGPGVVERSEFPTDASGQIRFGVITDVAGTIDVTSFVEDPNGTGANVPDNTLTASEPRVTSVLTTSGNDLSDIASVDAEPETGNAVVPGPVTFTARALNAANQGIAGQTITFDVTAGPNATAVAPTPCTAVTDNTGTASCSYTAGAGVGTDTIVAFVNTNTGTTGTTGADAGEPSDTITRTLQAALAAGATVELTADANRVAGADDERQNPLTDSTAEFSATVRNAAGVAISGALVNFTFVSGNEAATTTEAADSIAPTSALTDANGVARVVVTNPVPVTGDQIVARATIATGATTDPDDARVTFREPVVNEARNIALSPATAARVVGDAQTFTATVTDRFGNPVGGVEVLFAENGSGRFPSGSQAVAFTNASGVARAEVVTSIGETPGSNTVTATINDRTTGALNDECELPGNTSGFAGVNAAAFGTVATGNQPGAPAGNCSDTAIVTFTPSVVTPTRPATPTATATPTAGTGTPTPRPTGITCTNPAGITLDRSVTRPGRPVKVTIRSAPNSVVELLAYSRPSTTYRVARQAEVGASGVVEFMVVPGTNTRLFAQCVSQTRSASASVVINVRTAISLTVVRNSTRNYTFKGTILPKRAGQLISLYRVNANGTRVLSAQVKTDASGVYSFNRRFTGSGVFGFVTRTGQNLTNAAGESNTPDSSTTGVGTPRRTAIF